MSAAARRSSGSAELNRRKALDRRNVTAAKTSRAGLHDPPTPERGWRTLGAKDERLPMNRGDRLSDEKLGELNYAGFRRVLSRRESTTETSAVPRWSLYRPRCRKDCVVSSDPATSTVMIWAGSR